MQFISYKFYFMAPSAV